MKNKLLFCVLAFVLACTFISCGNSNTNRQTIIVESTLVSTPDQATKDTATKDQIQKKATESTEKETGSTQNTENVTASTQNITESKQETFESSQNITENTQKATINKSNKNQKAVKSSKRTVKILSAKGKGNIIKPKAKYSENGFRYRSPEGWEIAFSNDTISGTFEYNDALTDKQIEFWGHGGMLFDKNLKMINNDKLSFWSDYDSKRYAFDFPKDMDAGEYNLKLYQESNDKMLGEINIRFVISY